MVVFLWYNKDAYLGNVIPYLAKALPVAEPFPWLDENGCYILQLFFRFY